MPSSWYRGPDVLQVAERIWRNASRSGISTSNSTTSFALPYNIPLVSKNEVNEIDLTKDSADKIVIKISMVYTYPIDKSLHILKRVDVLQFII